MLGKKQKQTHKLFSTKACEGISNALPSIMLITLFRGLQTRVKIK